MTVEEQRGLQAARPEVCAHWLHRPDRFIDLVAGPCPYLAGDRCSVYDVRPYNCRRWMCGRSPGEALTDLAAVPLKVLTDPDLKAQYARNQADHQGWARAHGWAE